MLDDSLRQHKVDSCSQTDDELLDTFVPGLRRRVTKTDSSCSARSRASESRPPLNRKSSRHNTAVRELHETPGQTRQTFDTSENEETDCLLYSDHKLGANLLQGSEPGGGEHSPLLARRDKTDEDSTSEESLSEAHEAAAMEDLDDLLSGVCTAQEGSFGSSFCMSDWQTQVGEAPSHFGERNSTLSRNDNSSDDLPVCIMMPDDRLRQADRLLISSPLRLAKSAPVLAEAGPSGLRLSLDSDHVAVPNVIIQQASPCPSDQSSCSMHSIDSGRPSAESRDLTFNSQEDIPDCIPSTKNGYELKPRQRHRPHKSDQRSSSEHVDTFQEYLRNRGLDLDLTSVQSSDV